MKEYRFKRVLKNCKFFFSTLELENNSQAFKYAHETALNEIDVYCVDVYDGDLLLARFFRVVY